MNKEFSSLKAELESSRNEIRRLQGELDGLTFTQQSKAGRQLMAKCRKLQVKITIRYGWPQMM